MWLLDTTTLELKEFIGSSIPKYVILSHTWGPTDDEVSFSDMQTYREITKVDKYFSFWSLLRNLIEVPILRIAILMYLWPAENGASFGDMRQHRHPVEEKKGFSKVKNCCVKAVEDGYGYAWIDSCCIDKRSSAELSEAINSMYKYYADSAVCYVHLADVPRDKYGKPATANGQAFVNSRWFTRGWTLQELLAPRHIAFFTSSWTFIAAKRYHTGSLEPAPALKDFIERLAKASGIPEAVIQDPTTVHHYSSAQRMSWASRRQTTRGEDSAYCLMGLFNIHMPILYGEGETKAFHRLQLEIIQRVPDQSIFAWRRESTDMTTPFPHSGLLANSPRDFKRSSQIMITQSQFATFPSHKMTNMGLRISLLTQSEASEGSLKGYLECWKFGKGGISLYVEILLRPFISIQVAGSKVVVYRRAKCDSFRYRPFSDGATGKLVDIYVLEDAQIQYFQSEDHSYLGPSILRLLQRVT